ncbi:MAG TPA: BrnT family toxin [Pyrinomonadaceae bacterium]|nr:BrnT family toxin [Pyrinomonadaceae bacterium]
MKISGFIWLDDIVQKLLWKHSVTQQEVIEIFDNAPRLFFVEKGNRTGENVYVGFGQTGGRRYLVVFFIHKKNNQALILSARDTTKAERKKYAKK